MIETKVSSVARQSALGSSPAGVTLGNVTTAGITADLEWMNMNLRHGDPYGGVLSLDQTFLWRPFPRSPGHATAVERLWHIGASTWPGPGLGAGSGTLVANELLKPPASQRAVAKIRDLVARGQ